MSAADRPAVADLDARRRQHRARGPRPERLLREVYGEILRDERRDQDRSLADVAAAVGMSKQYLSEIERGRKEPSSEVLRSVCGALHLPVEHLLSRGIRRLTAARVNAPVERVRDPRVELCAA